MAVGGPPAACFVAAALALAVALWMRAAVRGEEEVEDDEEDEVEDEVVVLGDAGGAAMRAVAALRVAAASAAVTAGRMVSISSCCGLGAGERVSVVPCLLLILKTLNAFQKMFPQNCKKVKSTNKEHHKQDQSQN